MLTLKQVIEAKPKTIWYSANTVWWTHDEKDLKIIDSTMGLPGDIFNSPLLMTQSKIGVEQFLNAEAIKEHDTYGAKVEDRVRNLMLAHAKNIHLVTDRFKGMNFRENLLPIINRYKNFCSYCDEHIEVEYAE